MGKVFKPNGRADAPNSSYHFEKSAPSIGGTAFFYCHSDKSFWFEEGYRPIIYA
jgi:hypothetical protein